MRRTLAMGLALGSLCASAAAAQDLGFEGLTSRESVTVEADRYRVQATVDQAALDQLLADAEEATDLALESFARLVVAADREESDYYRTFTQEGYQTMRAAAAEVQEHGARAHALLAEASGVFGAAVREPMPRDTELRLLERVARAARAITLYDCLVDFVGSKPMRFETVAPIPFNELRAPIAQGLALLDLPRVQLRTVELAVANREVSEVGRAGDEPVLRDHTVVSRTRVTASLPLPVDKLRALTAEAERALARAQELKNALLAARVKETERAHGGAYQQSLEYRGELQDFERNVKPTVAQFAVAMARAKALRNELATWLDVADAFVGELNLRAAAERCLAAFGELAGWGSRWLVCYDAWTKIERPFRLIPGLRFAERHMVAAGSVIVRPQAPLPAGPSGSAVAALSTAELIRLLCAVAESQRYGMATANLARVTDLTVDNGLTLARYVYQSQRNSFLQLVQAELDRRARGGV